MRLLAIAAAALMVTGIAAVPASAQHRDGPGPGQGRPGPMHGGPMHGGHAWHGHRHCTTMWRHHHRVTRCH